jgi:hypothetical protein
MSNKKPPRQFAVPQHIIDTMIENMGHLDEHWTWQEDPVLGPVVTDLEVDDTTSGMLDVYCTAYHHR